MYPCRVSLMVLNWEAQMKEMSAKIRVVAHRCYNLFVPLPSVEGSHENVP